MHGQFKHMENIFESFAFRTAGLDEDNFAVIGFKGTEGVNTCYEFDIELMTAEVLDPEQVIAENMTFSLIRSEDRLDFHGGPSQLVRTGETGKYIHYRVHLTPRFRRLKLTTYNQIFLNKSVSEVITDVLKANGFGRADYELRLARDYPAWNYTCQYNETYYDFLMRWMEHYGIYYYFEQHEHVEKVIITDTHLTHTDIEHGRPLRYKPPSGLTDHEIREAVTRFSCRKSMVPGSVLLRDYNYRTPSQILEGRADVWEKGLGQVYYFADRCRNQREAETLAGVRAEEFLSRQAVYTGQSTYPQLRSGFTFQLTDHFRSEFNSTYLVTRVEHHGRQNAFGIAGPARTDKSEPERFYENHFEAIEASTQYRPPRSQQRPRIYGSLHAKIDAEGSGEYAEVDEMGRYRVVMPFDLANHKGGKASKSVRLIQPYAGQGHGVHFPLHKGTEVLIGFIDGHPDRPVITGVMPNPETASQITAGNETRCILTSGGQNKIHFEDKDGQQNITLASPKESSSMSMGAADSKGRTGFNIRTAASQRSTIQKDQTVTIGKKSSLIVGSGATFTTQGAESHTISSDDRQTYDDDVMVTSLGTVSVDYYTSSTEDPPSNNEIIQVLEEEHDKVTIGAHSVTEYDWLAREVNHKEKTSDSRVSFGMYLFSQSVSSLSNSHTSFRIRVIPMYRSATGAQARYVSLRADFYMRRTQLKATDWRFAFLYCSTVSTAKLDLTSAFVKTVGSKTKLGFKTTCLGAANVLLVPFWSII
jgi:type VI secretion system VgrG family protein